MEDQRFSWLPVVRAQSRPCKRWGRPANARRICVGQIVLTPRLQAVTRVPALPPTVSDTQQRRTAQPALPLLGRFLRVSGVDYPPQATPGPQPPSNRKGPSMPGWNFAEVWEVVAEQIPDAQAQVHGDRRVTWAEFDRRANGVAATLLDRGRHRAGQGGAVPLQRPRVHRVDVRGVQGRPRPHQHQLPVPGRRARLPVGQRRLRGRRVPRRVHRHDRAHPRPGPR